MSERKDEDGNWILTSGRIGRSASPYQRRDSRTRSSDFRGPDDPYGSHEFKERLSGPREDRYDDYVQQSTRERSRDHRRSESHQNVPQTTQHQSRSRIGSDFQRNQMRSETQHPVPPRKVFGPQLRDIEDDDYYSSRRKPQTSRGYQYSDSPDHSPQRRPDLPKKKTLPQPPTESPSRPRHRSVDSLGQQPSYSRDNPGQRHYSRDQDPRNSRYHDDQIQKVVDELHTKDMGRRDSHQSSRRSDQSYDTPIQVYETSQLRKAASLKAANRHQEYEPDARRRDSKAYSTSYRDYDSRDMARQGSRDSSNNLKQYSRQTSSKQSESNPKILRGQRSEEDEDEDMAKWRMRIQSPEIGQGFIRPSRSRDHATERKSDAQLFEVAQSKVTQRNSRSHDSVRKQEEQALRDYSRQRKSEISRSRESLGKSNGRRSRDHTPQRKSESPQRGDSSPDQMSFLSRSIEDLRLKHIYLSVSDEKSKHLKRYLNDVDCRSRESLNSLSGEKKNVRPGAPSEPNEYNFNYKRRGLFIIINNKNFHPETNQQTREGTDVDAERLEERFQDLGFEVKRYDDVTRSKMSTLMYDAASYDHSDADCFGCAILSHGVEGRVYGIDGWVSLEVLVMPFKGDKCPSLVGKPKLFFLQACRGTKMDYGVNVSDSSLSSRDDDEVDASSTVSIRKIPIEADFLFAYSTVPGYYSWRNNQDGSWFIQALCIVMENYGMKMELLHMLTHVNRIVAYEFASCTDREFTDKMKQMPCVVSMLTRYVYFRHKKQDIR